MNLVDANRVLDDYVADRKNRVGDYWTKSMVAVAIDSLRRELSKARESGELDRRLHQELLCAVACKFPGESRHETALRYIRERESSEVAKSRGDAAKQFDPSEDDTLGEYKPSLECGNQIADAAIAVAKKEET